jgi:predicted nucleic acid-binding protein
MSADRIFLDTNVFIYSFDSTSPAKQKIARDLIGQVIRSHSGVISYQVIQEFYNVAFRKFSTPMSQAEASFYFSNTFLPLYSVEFSPALLLRGFQIRNDYRISWYDALIFAAAVESESEILYSEDFQHGMSLADVRVRNPFLTN